MNHIYHIYFLYQDVNDEIPRFGATSLTGEVVENAPYKTPVTFLGNQILNTVSDPDQA